MKLSQDQYSYLSDIFRSLGSSIFFALVITSVVAKEKINHTAFVVCILLTFCFWFCSFKMAGEVKDKNGEDE